MIKVLPYLIEGLIILVALAFVYAQVILPFFRKTPFFPMFRSRPKIEKEIEAVNEQLADRQLEKVLASRQRKLGKKK